MKKILLLLGWALLALTVGPVCGYAVVLFKRMATASGTLLYTQTGAWYFVMPFGGALLVAVLYLFVPGASGEGMPSYVESMRAGDSKLPTRVTIAKFFSAAIVLASGGSGGIVGPITRICGGLGQDVGRFLKRITSDALVVRKAAICGAAAGISGVLAAPVTGALFAVEILYADGINYGDIFPALLASASSFLVVYTRADYQPFLGRLSHAPAWELSLVPALVIVAVVATVFGAAFCKIFSRLRDLMYRYVPHLSLRCIFGAAVVVLTAALFGRAVLGPGTGFIREIVVGKLPDVHGGGYIDPAVGGQGMRIAALLVLLAVGKLFSTTFTVGSGLSAGLTYPSILMGAALGSAGARLAGVNPASSMETHYAFVACGVAAMLASIMNIPLTATILVAEIFGLNQSVPGIIGSVVAYSLASHIVIYRYSPAHAGKLK